MSREDLRNLARPFPKRLIEPPPSGKHGNHVPHFVITQAVLAYLGGYSWELVEIIRGPVPPFTTKDGKSYAGLDDAIVGVVYRLTAIVDGREVRIEEAGVCEEHAYNTDNGDRLKKAISDAMKRCGMRLGLAIQLWCKRPDQHFLPGYLEGLEDVEPDPAGSVVGGAEPTATEFDAADVTFTESGSGPIVGMAIENTATGEGILVIDNGDGQLVDAETGAVIEVGDEPDNTAGIPADIAALLPTTDNEWLDFGTNQTLEDNTRELCRLMFEHGYWVPAETDEYDTFHRMLDHFSRTDPSAKEDASVPVPAQHWGDLKRKAHYRRFAGYVVTQVRKRLEAG